MTKGFAEIQQALATFEAQDLNMERFSRVSGGIIDLLQCYKKILDGKRILLVQSKLEQYFKKVESPAPFTSAASTATERLPSTSAASTTQPLHHLINISFNSCGMQWFSLFQIKYVFYFNCCILLLYNT